MFKDLPPEISSALETLWQYADDASASIWSKKECDTEGFDCKGDSAYFIVFVIPQKGETMKTITGEIDYTVTGVCPYCKKNFDLTQSPYYEQDTDGLLGLYVFGAKTTPAHWDKVGLEYDCAHCHKTFILGNIEY